MRGVFLDTDSLGDGLDLASLHASLTELHLYSATAPGQVAERIAGAEVVISNKVPVDGVAMAGAPHLKLICVAATGTNNVDLAAARERRVVVCNARGYGTGSVVQHAFTLILALMTRLPQYHQAVREGRWATAPQFCLLDYPIRELDGKTLGIVGYGELGQGVARIADTFGMEVLVSQRPGSEEPEPEPESDRIPLAALLPQVDVLSLHCPLTPKTRGLIGEWELALMRRDALLINTARGGIVDEAALAEALRRGALGGAGVDVLNEEPPVHGNPLLAPDIPNLIVTPHCAWGSQEARQRMVEQVAGNIRAFAAGTPQRVVT